MMNYTEWTNESIKFINPVNADLMSIIELERLVEMAEDVEDIVLRAVHSAHVRFKGAREVLKNNRREYRKAKHLLLNINRGFYPDLYIDKAENMLELAYNVKATKKYFLESDVEYRRMKTSQKEFYHRLWLLKDALNRLYVNQLIVQTGAEVDGTEET